MQPAVKLWLELLELYTLEKGGPFETEKEFSMTSLLKIYIYMSVFHQSLKIVRVGLANKHDIHFGHGDFSPIVENCHVTAFWDWE